VKQGEEDAMEYTTRSKRGVTWVGVSAALEPSSLREKVQQWNYDPYQILLERDQIVLINGYQARNQYILWVPLTDAVRARIKDELIDYEPPV
jgi:hypothetical protein